MSGSQRSMARWSISWGNPADPVNRTAVAQPDLTRKPRAPGVESEPLNIAMMPAVGRPKINLLFARQAQRALASAASAIARREKGRTEQIGRASCRERV